MIKIGTSQTRTGRYMNWRDRHGLLGKLCSFSIELHGLVTTLSDEDKVLAELRLDGALHLANRAGGENDFVELLCILDH